MLESIELGVRRRLLLLFSTTGLRKCNGVTKGLGSTSITSIS